MWYLEVERVGCRRHDQPSGTHREVALGLCPFHLVQVRAKAVTLDVEIGETPGQPLRQPPCCATEKRHDGRHEGHANEKGVKGDSDGESERDGFDRRTGLGNEREEYEEHDERRGRHHSGAIREPLLDGESRIAGLHELFAHARHQEDLVVHRQPEQHRHQDDRHETQHGPGHVDAEQAAEPSPLEYSDDNPERRDHAEKKSERCLDRNENRTEDHRQQHDGKADDDDAEGDERTGEPTGDVDSDRGRTGHGDGEPELLLEGRSAITDVLHERFGFG